MDKGNNKRLVGRSTRRRNQRMGRRDFYHFQKTKRAPNGRRRNKAKGLGVEKIKARVQNPVRGGAWVPFFFCKHSIKSATSQLFSKRQGTLARPLGNIPRRLFFISRNGLRPRPDKPDNPGAVRRGVGKGGNWSICRISAKTQNAPSPFSSSERSIPEKKCNTVTTFGKIRKSES